ncbi:MAG: hypothetical protein ACLQMF_10510 [Rectinemataceae bacterium]
MKRSLLRWPGPSEAASGATTRLSAFIPREMKRLGIRGLSIAVADGEGTLWSSGFGWADKRKGRSFEASTISKPRRERSSRTATSATPSWVSSSNASRAWPSTNTSPGPSWSLSA